MDIDNLKKLVGQRYQKFDTEGNYINCFSPVYLMYPNCPRFKKPKSNKCFEYALLKVKKYCTEIQKEKMQPFDIIVFFKLFRAMHIGIYLGDGLILHCAMSGKYEIIKLTKYWEYIKGVFRYNEI